MTWGRYRHKGQHRVRRGELSYGQRAATVEVVIARSPFGTPMFADVWADAT